MIKTLIFISSFSFAVTFSGLLGAGDVPADLTGSRSGSDITATEQWNGNFSVTWNIENIGGSHPWSYQYIFTVPKKDFSHILLEVSQNTDESDFVFMDGDKVLGPEEFGDEGKSNPGIPETIYSLKLDDTNGTTVTWEFFSTRAPVWGDFYAKDGKNKGNDVYAYNKNFGMDPNKYKESGDFSGFIARPDTRMEVPEPMTMILLGSSLGAAALAKRRRKSSI